MSHTSQITYRYTLARTATRVCPHATSSHTHTYPPTVSSSELWVQYMMCMCICIKMWAPAWIFLANIGSLFRANWTSASTKSIIPTHKVTHVFLIQNSGLSSMGFNMETMLWCRVHDASKHYTQCVCVCVVCD